MKATSGVRLAVLVLCVALARQAAAAPLITRVDPTEFDASKDEGMRVVLVRGYDIWVGPSGYDEYARRTKVFMRREGAFEPVRTYAHGYWTGTDEQELTLNVPTHPWFDSPGTFEVMVKVDDVASNYYQVPVLKGPPSIRKVNPSQFTLSEARDQEHEVWIVADNLGNVLNTSALLDGKPIQCYRLGPGALTAFIPESVFKQPGKFGLQVKSSVGLSAKVDITLTGPPLRIDLARQGTEQQAARGIALQSAVTAAAPIVEGESLVAGAKATAGAASRQEMAAFGDAWSGGAQMLWTAPGAGAKLTTTLDAPAAGRYVVTACFTKAADYAIVRLALNGQPLGSPFDGYGQGVTLSAPVELGAADLKAGGNELVLEVTGKNPLSSGFYVGLDRIVLAPASARVPAPTLTAPLRRLQPAP
jgi:hypothetical protein